MAWPSQFFADDEELGKKNDDHRPLNGSPSAAAWSVRKPASSIRKRRIIYIICAVVFVCLFVKNIPTDVGPHPRWADTRVYQGPKEGNLAAPSTGPPARKPPRPPITSEAQEHYHDGPIKFYKLASSLHSVARFGGLKDANKNVLFAAANLKSLSELMPLACEMARWERSDVHFAVMGRDDMDIQELQNINGAKAEDCNLHWHDARPDYSRWSSDYRMEVSVAASLGHIQEFIHPQVIIVDDPNREDSFFVTAMRGRALDLFKPMIELPPDATENLMWMTRLDSASLAAWPRVYIDLLVQAPSQSSGSLVRLLKSVENADYFGVRRPHLTIELPSEIDPPTWRYLENLMWPPIDWSGAPHVTQVSLRHRVPRRTTTPEEAAARLVESFYPIRTLNSHVLLLSPQVELSPLYYHYLLYTLLEYKYSNHAKASKDAANLMGISLHLPTAFLNDTADFKPPLKEGSRSKGSEALLAEQSAFLWQAPNNDAALYFGEKWMEFHSFLMARLSKPPSTTPKIVSEKHPSWLEYMLELMRARGWAMAYPGLFANDVTLTTVHDELYRIPEEFFKKAPESETSTIAISADQTLEADSSFQARKAPPNTEHPLLKSSLTSLLPNQGDLPEVANMPLISYDGRSVSPKESSNAANSFSESFRHSTGACGAGESPLSYSWTKAADLFCHLDDIYDHHAAAGPMSMEQNYPTSNPNPQPSEPEDLDKIDPDHAIRAKEEAARHLDRQAGASKAGVEAAAVKQQGEKNANDKGLQDEFKAQMERQNKKASSGEKKPGQNSVKEQPEQVAGEKESQPQPTTPAHGAFNKENPKEPDEKLLVSSEGKSPGW